MRRRLWHSRRPLASPGKRRLERLSGNTPEDRHPAMSHGKKSEKNATFFVRDRAQKMSRFWECSGWGRRSGEGVVDPGVGVGVADAAFEFGGELQPMVLAEARGYDSVLELMLSPTNLPLEVFHNLIETFKAHLPTWHRYWDIKARILEF